MDEAAWLSSDDARRMVAAIRSRCGERELRLIACACCRVVWDLLTDRRSRRAVEAAERHADGPADGGLLVDRFPAAVSAAHKIERKFGEDDPRLAAATAASYTVLLDPAADVARFTVNQLLPAVTTEGHARLTAAIRDVVGNPYRPAPGSLRTVPASARGGPLRLRRGSVRRTPGAGRRAGRRRVAQRRVARASEVRWAPLPRVLGTRLGPRHSLTVKRLRGY